MTLVNIVTERCVNATDSCLDWTDISVLVRFARKRDRPMGETERENWQRDLDGRWWNDPCRNASCNPRNLPASMRSSRRLSTTSRDPE